MLAFLKVYQAMPKNAIDKIKTLLEHEIASGNIYWNINKETVDYLSTLLLKYKPMRSLEIGTSTGYSAICIAEMLVAWDGRLITIESNETRFNIAKTNIMLTGLQNITQIKGHAPEILSDISGTFDFIFFDGTKYEYVSYFTALKNRINHGGIIVADNAISHEKEINEYKKTVEANFQFVSYIKNVGAGLLVSEYILL